MASLFSVVKIRGSFLLLLAVLGALCLPSCSPQGRVSFLTDAEQQWLTAHQSELTIAPDLSYAPLEFIDDNGQFQGIAADYVALIEQKLGVHFQILRIPDWNENVRKAKAHEFAIWSCVGATSERSTYMLFSAPYVEVQPIFVVPQSRAKDFSFAEAGTQTIAVVDGYFLHAYLLDSYPQLTVLPVVNAIEGLQAVASGRAVAMLSDVSTASYLINKHGFTGLRVGGNPGIPAEPMSFAVRNDWPLMQSILNKTLARISPTERQAILDKWVGLNAADNGAGGEPWWQGGGLLLLAFPLVVLAIIGFIFRKKRRTLRLKIAFVTVVVVTLCTLLFWGAQSLIPKLHHADLLTVTERQWLNDHAAELIIAPDYSFAPVEFINAQGVFQGIAADYTHLLEEKLGCTFTIVKIRDWQENVARAQNQEFAIWSAVAPTPQKQAYMLFTRPYLELLAALIVAKDVPGEVTLETFGQRSIAVVDGYFTQDYLRRAYPNITMVAVANAAAGLRAVAFNEVDAMLIDLATASHLIEKEGISTLKVADTMDLDYGLAFASRKDWPMLRQILDKGLAAITPQERQKIYANWVHYQQPDKLLSRNLLLGVLLLGSLLSIGLGAVLFWNRSLRQRVATQTRDLAIRENEYRQLFEANPNPMWVYDQETLAFLAVNNAAVAHYGYSRQDFLNMTIKDIRPPEDVPALLVQVGQNAAGLNESGVWRHCRKDGQIILVEISSHQLDFAGRAAKVVLAFDITERHQLEEQLRQAQKLETVGRLAGGVAHDFNNLLGVIIGYAEIIKAKARDNDPWREDLEEIDKAAKRAAALTRQLLAFSRKQVLQPEVLNLNELIAGTEKMLRRLIGENIDLVVSLDAALGRIKADPGQIEQVIMNLAVNARDAMPRGGKLTIETRNVDMDAVQATQRLAVVAGPHVLLAVTDTGSGMNEATLGQIFEPFFTTKELGKGTGLGLASVYGIVKQSGGGILVDSEEGQGASFKIYLPRVEEPARVDQEEADESPARGVETLLLVEDEEGVRHLAARVLSSAGYHVLSAANGEEALSLVAGHQGVVHLLLTDVIMPVMGGRELATRLLSSRPDLKVLYMSGYTNDAIVDQGVLDQGTQFIGKPFSVMELTRKVREVLDS